MGCCGGSKATSDDAPDPRPVQLDGFTYRPGDVITFNEDWFGDDDNFPNVGGEQVSRR